MGSQLSPQSQAMFTVLIVDDNQDNRYLLETALEDDASYQTVSLDSGEACLEQVETIRPDIILLDIRMLGLDGYQTCEHLRQLPAFRFTPIIFLSVLDTLDDILAGYQAGGDDYLSKPFETEILLAKIKTCLNQRKEVEQNIKQSHQFAQLAMANSGELGVILRCYQNSFQCRTHHELAKELLDACQDFGLICSVQIRGADHEVNLATGGPCTSLEIKLMEQLIGAERIFHFGNRTAFNFARVTLLVKNMPVEDLERLGRYNDHLASMLLGIEARAEIIDLDKAKEQEVLSRVKSSLDDIHAAIEKIESAFLSREHLTTTIIETLLSQMTVGFSSLALTEAQEQFFLELINTHLNKIIELYGSGTEIKDYFLQIAGRLTPLLDAAHVTRPSAIN